MGLAGKRNDDRLELPGANDEASAAARKNQPQKSAQRLSMITDTTPASASGAATTSPGMFADADALKGAAHKDLDKRDFDIMDYYKTTGIMQSIGRASLFTNGTLVVIVLNSFWIGIEMDLNTAESLDSAQWYFQFGEYFFFGYFLFEWIVRFCALKRKRDGLLDKWFIFDSGLVGLMVFEMALVPMIMQIATAASGGGGEESGGSDSGMGDLSMLRMLRLLRLTRMVRIMRAVPELVTLLKSMALALRSVLSTLTLLILFMYIFAIIFKSQLKIPEDDWYLEWKFGRIPSAMWTLLMSGAFLDQTTTNANALLDADPLLTMVFLTFIFLAAFTVLNMLIGLLCEVVTAVAAAEKEKAVVSYVKSQLFDVLESLDEDKSGTISKKEFEALLAIPEAVQALDELGVDVPNLVSLSHHLFEADEIERFGIESVDKSAALSQAKDEELLQSVEDIPSEPTEVDDDEAGVSLGFADFLEMVIRLRAGNRPSVLDIVDLRKLVLRNQRQVIAQVNGIEHLNSKMCSSIQDMSGVLGKFCTQHRAMVLGLSLDDVPIDQAGTSSGSKDKPVDKTVSLPHLEDAPNDILEACICSEDLSAKTKLIGPSDPLFAHFVQKDLAFLPPGRPPEQTTNARSIDAFSLDDEWLHPMHGTAPMQPKESWIDGEHQYSLAHTFPPSEDFLRSNSGGSSDLEENS